MASRSSGTPCVAPYCSALVPYFSKTEAARAGISATGKVSAAGYPPAKEQIAERSTFRKISLTGERRNDGTSAEKYLS